MSLEHKDYVLPEVNLSHDEGDPRWHAAQASGLPLGALGSTPLYREDGTIHAYQFNGLEPDFWKGYWQACIADEWARIVAEYEASPGDVYCAWTYLDHHPVFWRFTKERRSDYPADHVGRLEHEYAMTRGWPEISPHKVNAETGCFEDDKPNTKTQWWYEFGPWSLHPDEHGGHVSTHDYKLDGGADTYEQAVVDLARKVWENYGNDRRIVDSEEWRKGGGDDTETETNQADSGL